MELTQSGFNGLTAKYNEQEAAATTDTERLMWKHKQESVKKLRDNRSKGILKNSLAMLGITPDNLNSIESTVGDQAKRNMPTDNSNESRNNVDNAGVTDQVNRLT